MAVAQPATVAAPPKTGHHTLVDGLREEALAHFFENPQDVVCSPTSGGVNNVCQYVDVPGSSQRYILRVYNNGNNSDKVRYEHEVLTQLQTQQDRLSFQVPKAKPSLTTGKPFMPLSNGAESCVFYLIPGTLAKTTTPAEVGRATGELCSAMAAVNMGDFISPTARYCDVFRAHYAMNRELFFNEVETNPGFAVCQEAIDYLVAEIRAIEPKLVAFEASDMPRQVIHADLHYDNVLVQGDKVAGLLDFEFCLYDFRAMELAVALSKYVGENEPLPLIEEFVTGYAINGELTQAEIEAIPDFINLRIFSNVIYFTGRAWAKEDGLDSLTTRAGTYAKRVRWVNANRQAIVDAITQRMKAAK